MGVTRCPIILRHFVMCTQSGLNSLCRCMTQLSVFLLFLRLEQQALHLVEKIKSLGSRLFQLSAKEGELEARQQVNSDHVEFLVNMSRATRRKDWAWFEIAEMELQKLYVFKLRVCKKGKLRQCTLLHSSSLSPLSTRKG